MNELTEMKADMVKELAILLMRQNKDMELNEALAIIFNSDTYQKVMDDKAGLYYQSPRYVFSFLDTEIKNGKIC
ncbi:hypothetical protein [uncultured Prevotella sp.]|uniref:hypothetical protein n=1 Tax=uncultured Prevotella sp. TaxID=159272 RepID=UPI00263272F1|nr:hypothetical protein [uncultured Prevotella sp.]